MALKVSNKSSLLPKSNENFLDYEWPQLPPINEIKEAICRRRVSSGLTYILPIDKTRNSINATYRTDLRTLFKCPYLNNTAEHASLCDNSSKFNDSRVQDCRRYHQLNNTRVTFQSAEEVKLPDHSVNLESMEALMSYSRSAPKTGISNRRTIGSPDQLRRRSSLYRTTHDHEPPEVIKLREEADRIVRSVYGSGVAGVVGPGMAGVIDRESNINPNCITSEVIGEALNEENHDIFNKARRSTVGALYHKRNLSRQATRYPEVRKNTASHYSCYEELVRESVPTTRYQPPTTISPYLTNGKNSSIWHWLHGKEVPTKFSHFMDICG